MNKPKVKKKYVVVDENSGESVLCGTLSEVKEHLEKTGDYEGYEAEDIEECCKIYEVTREINFTAEGGIRVSINS